MKAKISAAFFYLFTVGLLLSGALLAAFGLKLAWLGGSPFYAFSGGLLIASGIALFMRRILALYLAAICFGATWAWAFYEVGPDGWALLPRVDFITGVMLLFLVPAIVGRLRTAGDKRQAQRLSRIGSAGIVGLLAAASLFVWFMPQGQTITAHASAERAPTASSQAETADASLENSDWKDAHFSRLSQINRGNVAKLKRVWTYTRPSLPEGRALEFRDEATPLEVDGKLFVCMADNMVVALDAEDGHAIWTFNPHVNQTGVYAGICRGVAYFESPKPDSTASLCDKRILMATLDARLIALDSETGQLCPGFGQNGEVSLRDGMGAIVPGRYYQTSPPVVVDGAAIIGGYVADGDSTGEPSGVVRAFDAQTGKLAWAWDLGRQPGNVKADPAAIYTRGTPNVWGIMSADPKLGLVYLPTGNATPDYVGSYRKPLWEKYASSLVALDVKSGEVRWSYQFVHHDLWDYDSSAKPMLFDMPTEKGPVPAVLQATKNGQLFVLDRRTGKPLVAVRERPVPQTDVPGEWTSKTQPFSVGMPNVAGPALNERMMWGLTPFDQLLSRIKFRQMRYDGMFTPPSLKGSIIYPGPPGGVDWGSVSVDKGRDILIVPSTRLALVVRLATRSGKQDFTNPQLGTPYGAYSGPLMTVLGVPRQQPPYSMLTAIDLHSRKVIWERPVGTAEYIGPLGIASHLPFTIGAPPVVGGPITTAGGLVFVGAFNDRRLRAFDTRTGKLLWSDKLPQGNQATPITYRAPRSGRQMVAIVSGGQARLKGRERAPESVVAYAIP